MGTTTSFNNTPQAGDDFFTSATTGLTEDYLSIITLAVMANDLGGAAKTLYSIDDGTNSIGVITPTDLLAQDIVRTEALSTDRSAHGARIWITDDGKVGYDASALSSSFKADLQHLSAGQFLNDTFTYAIRLGNGTLSWATATIQIMGVNDAPVVVGAVTANALEDGSSVTLNALACASDVDNGAALSVTNVPASLPPGVTYDATTQCFTLDPSHAAYQHLAAGQTTEVIVTYSVSDGIATTAASVKIIVTGTNDAAVISGAVSGTVTEAGGVNNASAGTPTASGTLTDTDVDNAPNSFQAVAAGTTSSDAYGTYSVTTGGAWSYTLDNSNAAVQALNVGGTLTDHITVTTVDGTTQVVTVTINGTNDAPNAPTITRLTDDVSPVTGTVANGASTNDTTPTVRVSLTGTGAVAGDIVQLFNGASTLGSAVTLSSGDISAGFKDITPSALSQGTYNLNATITDTGNTSAHSTDYSVTVDTKAPTVSITSTALANPIGSTSTITFQFSETVSGFILSDATPTRGTLSNFIQVDGDTYTATFLRTANGVAKLDVAAGSYTDNAGNAGAAGSSPNFPAGIAGEQINLALTGPSGHVNDLITVTVAEVPSDWTLNAGTNNGDGTWTVQTNDISTLAVTTSASYTGAMLLPVTMTWTNADGTAGTLLEVVNVEAYAPGSPIFAVSADDHLTGSSGADLFVFAQPIAHDTIHNFDAAADKIDLMAFNGVSGYGDLVIANDVSGNAVVTTETGETITILGVDAAALSADNFMFNQEPITTNVGNMAISDGAILPLGGIIDNTGTIALDSTGSETDLEILAQRATLQGGGHVTLSDNSENVIYGGSADVTLINADNTISGAGHLGNGQLTLINNGTIIATGANALIVDTGANIVTNSGTLEATGTGGLIIDGDVANSGLLWANGGNITISGSATGTGDAIIDKAGVLELGAASSVDTTFAANATGTLKLDAASSYTGTVSGFGEGDTLDLADLIAGPSTAIAYTPNQDGTGGTLSITDGARAASIQLSGEYSVDSFHIASDAGTGTLVSYLPPIPPTDHTV
jgi:VCBS repeat-containing protein